MPQQDVQENQVKPEADEGERFFADVADDAVRSLMGGPRREAATPPPSLPEVGLDPDEEAALAGDVNGPAEMPSDDELDALLRGEAPDETAYDGRPDAQDLAQAALAAEARDAATPDDHESDEPMSAAASALAAELDAELSEHAPADPDPRPAAVVTAETPESPAGKPSGTPLWVRPLVWLNAPLSALPSPLRDAMGKIGLVTTLNAAAILLYVAVIRR